MARPAIHPGEILANELAEIGVNAVQLGTGPDFWMNLQASYDFRLAEQEHGAAIRETVVPRQEPPLTSPGMHP